MAWTSPRTWTSGEVVTDTIMNAHVRDNLNAIANAPYVHVRAVTATTTIGTSATAVQWDTEVADTDNMYTSSANTRVTANTPGLYLAQGGYGVRSATANSTFACVWLGSSAVVGQGGTSVGVGTGARDIGMTLSTYIRLYANDYVQLGAFHQSASGTPITAAGASGGYYGAWLQLRWVGP